MGLLPKKEVADLKMAVIATVFNRREKTQKAINSLMYSIEKMNIQYHFYICDDGSTDGTRNMLEEIKCPLTVIEGNGELFWSKGMYAAMQKAVLEKYDLYLMINDDVDFYEDAVQTMIESYKCAGEKCGIVGSTKNDDNNKISYGGRNLATYSLIVPDGKIQRCDLANWNCFLIDNYVIESVGLIDNYYEHGLGDFDYSLQMQKKKFHIFVAKNYVGICRNNLKENTYHDKNLPRKKRFKSMIARQNMPIKSRWHYYMKNFGFFGLKDFIWPYIKCSYCILMGKDY